MFAQYSAALRDSSPGENTAPIGQAFIEAIAFFCKRERSNLEPEALAWFSSTASTALKYLKEQLCILGVLDSKGVLRLYTDQIPTALRMHGDVFIGNLGHLLEAGGLIANVSVVDTRIAIEITLPQDLVIVSRRLGGEVGLSWDFMAESFGKAKDGRLSGPYNGDESSNSVPRT